MGYLRIEFHIFLSKKMALRKMPCEGNLFIREYLGLGDSARVTAPVGGFIGNFVGIYYGVRFGYDNTENIKSRKQKIEEIAIDAFSGSFIGTGLGVFIAPLIISPIFGPPSLIVFGYHMWTKSSKNRAN